MSVTIEELVTAGKFGKYALLVGYDDVNSKFRPITVAYDELTGRSSLVMSRGHGTNTHSVELIANHAAAAELTPTAGKKLAIVSAYGTTDAAAGEVKLDFLTSAKPVFRLYASKTNSENTGEMHIVGAADEVLTLETTTGDQKVHQLAKGKKVRPSKRWWNKMYKSVSKQYPTYKKKRKSTIVAGIWHKYSVATQKKLVRRYA